MKDYIEAIEIALNFMKNHKVVTCIICAFILAMHIVANVIFIGKPVPITHIVLRPWMAYINMFGMAVATGVASGYAIAS